MRFRSAIYGVSPATVAVPFLVASCVAFRFERLGGTSASVFPRILVQGARNIVLFLFPCLAFLVIAVPHFLSIGLGVLQH
jgi:hypothetical protein